MGNSSDPRSSGRGDEDVHFTTEPDGLVASDEGFSQLAQRHASELLDEAMGIAPAPPPRAPPRPSKTGVGRPVIIYSPNVKSSPRSAGEKSPLEFSMRVRNGPQADLDAVLQGNQGIRAADGTGYQLREGDSAQSQGTLGWVHSQQSLTANRSAGHVQDESHRIQRSAIAPPTFSAVAEDPISRSHAGHDKSSKDGYRLGQQRSHQ